MLSSDRAIENLTARYAFLVDDGDFAGLGKLLDAADFTLGPHSVRGEAAVQPVASGRYRDTFERRAGIWHFSSRVVSTDLVGDLSHHVRASRAE